MTFKHNENSLISVLINKPTFFLQLIPEK